MRRGLDWVAGVVVLALSGCGSEDCDSVGYAAVAVRVQDASGEQVCDAAVRVTDRDFSEELFASDTSVYYGAYERAGTYRVEASRSGATGIVDRIEVVTTGGSGVLNTAQVAVELSAYLPLGARCSAPGCALARRATTGQSALPHSPKSASGIWVEWVEDFWACSLYC